MTGEQRADDSSLKDSHRSPPTAARVAVAVMFLINGAVQGNWVVRIPAVQGALGASSGALGAALLGLPVGLLLAVPVTGGLAARVGSRPLTRAGVVGYPLVLPLAALAPSIPALFLALLVAGVASGMLDVAMNTQGVAVERLYRRPILSGFHGLFSVGGLVGAAMGGAIASLGVAPLPHFVGVGALLALVGWVASRRLLPAHTERMQQGPVFAWPGRKLLGLGIIAFCVLLGEGAVADWSAVYLRRVLEASPGLAAAGFSAFSLTMAGGRLVGDQVRHQLGNTRLVRLGGAAGALGMALAIVASRPVLAVAGFALVGLGLATLFPVVISAAGQTPRMAPGSAIAAATTLGYLGLLGGPPLIGFVAEATSLRGGLTLVAVLSGLIVLLAGAAGSRRPFDA